MAGHPEQVDLQGYLNNWRLNTLCYYFQGIINSLLDVFLEAFYYYRHHLATDNLRVV